MTPKQLLRQKQLLEASEKLKVAKKDARIRARAEAKAYFEVKYREYRNAAVEEYYKVAFSSTDDVVKRELDILLEGTESYEDDLTL